MVYTSVVSIHMCLLLIPSAFSNKTDQDTLRCVCNIISQQVSAVRQT